MIEKTRVIEDNFDAFNNYVLSFDFKERMIEYKYNHSYRVMTLSERIAKSLNLNKDDIYLAMLIGLLHDIGRFEQWTQVKTFTDDEKFDHSTYAVELLFEKGKIKDYLVEESDYEVIRKSILYHNDFTLEGLELSEREKMFCKIIRDADKLDILYAFSCSRLLELEEDDSKVSEIVKESFYNNIPSNHDNIITKSDRIISLLQFTYDIYFDESYKIIKEEDYYGSMYEHIKNKKLFNIYFEVIDNYINERVK